MHDPLQDFFEGTGDSLVDSGSLTLEEYEALQELRKQTKAPRLFAFWKYDLFPYYLGGAVKRMDEKGRVYIKSYQGWFKPLILLPLDEGKRLNEELEKLRAKHRLLTEELNKRLTAEVDNLLFPNQ